MRQPCVLPVLAVLSCFSGGCLFGQGMSPREVAAARAPTDLGCAAEKVKVTELGSSTTIRAEGCGKAATYSCMGGNFGNPYDARCEREAEQPAVAASPAPVASP